MNSSLYNINSLWLLTVARGFLGWNIPELYIRRRIALTQNHPSPFDVSNTPPSDISVHTPPSPEGMSPGLYRAVSFDVAELNAEKLMVGDFGALLRSLDGNGKRYKLIFRCFGQAAYYPIGFWRIG